MDVRDATAGGFAEQTVQVAHHWRVVDPSDFALHRAWVFAACRQFAEQGGAVALSRQRCELPAYGLQGGVQGVAVDAQQLQGKASAESDLIELFAVRVVAHCQMQGAGLDPKRHAVAPV